MASVRRDDTACFGPVYDIISPHVSFVHGKILLDHVSRTWVWVRVFPLCSPVRLVSGILIAMVIGCGNRWTRRIHHLSITSIVCRIDSHIARYR